MSKPNNNKAARGKNRKSGNVKLSAEQERELLAKQLKIKPRTKLFVDELLNNKKISQTQAYINTHETNNRKVASIEASKLLRKPSVIGYKDSAVKMAKDRIVTLVKSDNESIALKASQDIIDRNEGKAIQKTENSSRTVHVSLDITGTRIGGHYIPSEPKPAIDIDAVS